MSDFDPDAYLDSAAAALALAIAPADRPAVIENLARLQANAEQLLAFDVVAATEGEAENE